MFSAAPRRLPQACARQLLVLSVLSAWGCTLTSDEFQPSPVIETDRLGGAGAPAAPEQPQGSTERPAPVLDPGEVQPPFDLMPDDLGNENAGGTRSSADGTGVLDAGVDASDAGDGGPGRRDSGSSASDASTNEPDAGANERDAGAPNRADAGATPSELEPEEPEPEEPEPEEPARAPCPGLVFEGSCYEFFADQVSWYVAEERCVAWGGHLASVESLEEDAFLGAWPALLGIRFLDGSGLWLGGTDASRDWDFRWWDDRPLSYVSWAPGQPNNGPGVDCIEKRNDITQRWYDRRCSDGERYVCERPQ